MHVDDSISKNQSYEKSKGDPFASKSVDLLEKLSKCISTETASNLLNALGFALSRIDDPTGQSYEYWLYNAALTLESISRDSGPCSAKARAGLAELISQTEDKLYARVDYIERKQLATLCFREWQLIEKVGIKRIPLKELRVSEDVLDVSIFEDRLSSLEAGGVIDIFTLDNDNDGTEYIQLSSKGLTILTDPVSIYGPAKTRAGGNLPKLDGSVFSIRRQIAAEFGDEIALDRRNYESPEDVRQFHDNFDLALISAISEK